MDFLPRDMQYYTKDLYQHIPKEAYRPATYKLVYMILHATFIFGAIYICANSSSLLVGLVTPIISGISIACLFLFSHELSHGTIVKRQPLLYISQFVFWTFSGIPPTMWKKVHNLSHHRNMNTYNDPDRRTFKSESTWLVKLYNYFIYPNKILRYSLTIGFAMMFYSVKHTLAVFYRDGIKPDIVTFRPSYTYKEKLRILFEYLFQILFWVLVINFIGGYRGLYFAMASWYCYSALVIIFIITQHLRDEVFIDTADPLLTTTSVIIPAWLDRIIDWHSYHIEHHLFPGINFDYYRDLSPHIERKFSIRYSRIPLLQALKECFDNDILVDDPLV